MPSPEPPADLSRLSLADIARMAADRKLPPVASWNPAHCGHSEMRIAADGTWFHQGVPIARPAMVRLFASILRREPDGRHVLVTPAEKLDIDVEDAAFVAVEVKSEGQRDGRRLAFRLNTGEVLVAGPEHALGVEDRGRGPHPYLSVRAGLEALVSRPVFYELADFALEDDAKPPGLWSDGVFFPL
ncbi:MAG: FIG003620: Proteophosphoglycan precursor (Fragment) [uncultured Sphingomonadaceae bacterium]|uniref:FIG003620: Proteophosphoglycan n=1 Tax=uncultured Sphingomonadaceae bacterium TaxID=169976 RepID=A0A6J4SW78_9SPHN